MQQIILLISIIFLISSNSYSHDLSAHRWKERLILILAADTNVKLFGDQVDELLKDEKGLIERRLKVYKITPTKYSFGLKDKNFIGSNIFYKEYKKTNTVFEIILIGLDGGIKLRKKGLLTIDELLSIIDRMPMRQAEIREKLSD